MTLELARRKCRWLVFYITLSPLEWSQDWDDSPPTHNTEPLSGLKEAAHTLLSAGSSIQSMLLLSILALVPLLCERPTRTRGVEWRVQPLLLLVAHV